MGYAKARGTIPERQLHKRLPAIAEFSPGQGKKSEPLKIVEHLPRHRQPENSYSAITERKPELLCYFIGFHYWLL
ncbi:hypothetical protein [Phormidium sp. CCY1219]|uniref:hypothetical protein n=1 Tax=Phormidium sp. CCY1219 TaxID=2886104 RepID=UPI002D1F406B|nr:hypothetical protein [Phormidium sp. CCY1219]MEB3829630.1 hypothetical protein [Phormidium sp. CCY1219]